MLLREEFEKIEKEAIGKQKARNNAASAIRDAKARYVKTKTRARSKKAALEKDAALHSKRFDCLNLFDKREDIQEYFGFGDITESERDRLEDLWDEREHIREMSVDGVYSDLVTQCLDLAEKYVSGLFEDEIEEYEEQKHIWEKEQKKADELHHQMHEEYKAWKNGWGKYAQSNREDEDENI